MAPRTAKAKKNADVKVSEGEVPKKGRGKAKNVTEQEQVVPEVVIDKNPSVEKKTKRGKNAVVENNDEAQIIVKDAPPAKKGRKKAVEEPIPESNSLNGDNSDENEPAVQSDDNEQNEELSESNDNAEDTQASAGKGRKKVNKKEPIEKEVKPKETGRGKKNVKQENITAKKDAEEKPKARGRGRKVQPKAEDVQDNDEVEVKPKGRKKAQPKVVEKVQKADDEDDEQEEIPDEEAEEEKPVEEVKKKGRKNADKKTTPKEDSEQKDDEVKEQMPVSKSRKGAKKDEKAKGDTKDDDKDDVAESKPVKGKRGQKKAEASELQDTGEPINKRRRKDDKGYSVEQHVQIIKLFYENGSSVRATFRALRPFYGRDNRPAESTIRRLVDKFESTGSVNNQPVPVRQRNARSAENIAAVRDSVLENPRQSIPRRAQELGLSQTTTWRILRCDLSLHPYKIQLTQELKVNDHRQRRVFADWALEQLEVDADFGKKIIFSDEAHFWMNGYVNKQNCRIWDETNPHEVHQVAMHPQKVTVWCGFWAGGVIGPYFFENDNGVAVTVNGERYRSMITNFFWPEIENMDLDNMWFQQDGATCHTAHATMEVLHEQFLDMVISRGGDVNWPPRSCDLTPLDFFLWGFLKSQVYANKPQTTDALKVNIRHAIDQIQPDLCARVIENWTFRVRATNRSRGGHLNDVIFHT